MKRFCDFLYKSVFVLFVLSAVVFFGSFYTAAPSFAQGAEQTQQPNQAVKRLQELLNTVGFGSGSPDGIFDDQVVRAVRAWEAANGIQHTENFEPSSMRMLEQQALSVQSNQRAPQGNDFARAMDAARARDLALANQQNSQRTVVQLPEYLREEGNFFCLNSFQTPSRESCDKLLSEILVSKNQGNCTFGRNRCLEWAFGFTGGMSRAKHKELIRNIVNYRRVLADLYTRNQQQRMAQAGGAVASTTFLVNGQSFTLPNIFKRSRERNNIGSIYIDVWTNFHEAQSCPPTAFVLLNFKGVNANPTFETWYHESNWGQTSISVRRALRTGGEGASERACRGSNNYAVIYHFLDNGTYFGSQEVPANQLEQRGDGVDYMYNNFDRQMREYTQNLSRYTR